MTAPAGALVRLHLDIRDQVLHGDVIRTGTGRCYRVIHVRQQQRGIHQGRWHVQCVVLEAHVRPQGRIHDIRWYKR